MKKEGGVMRKIIIGLIVVILSFGVICSCGGSSTSSSGGSDSGDSGDSGGGSDTSTGFTVSGTLNSVNVSLSKSLVSGTITDIMAVSPETGSVTCKKASVGSDGAFSIKIDGQKPWFLFFLDSLKQGIGMFMGRLRASSTLDTFTPASTTGSTDLGTVTVDAENEVADSSKTEDQITSDLGLDSDTVDTIKGVDDVARRYGNPDMDSDGSVDCDSESSTASSYYLDFHIRFNMLISGTNAKVTDILDGYYSDSVAPTYTSTGIYVGYLNTFSSAATGSVTFVDDSVTTEEGGSIAANTASSDVTELTNDNYYMFGPNLTSASATVQGDAVFSFDGKTLTFPDVRMPTLAELQSPAGRIFPFVKINKTDANCTSNCTIASIDYKWMKKTATGWTNATLSELTLLIGDGGFGFRVNGDANKYIFLNFAASAVSSNVTWSSANFALTGVSGSEFQSVVISDICHIGLSYDDKLGMKYFQNITNATGTCANDT